MGSVMNVSMTGDNDPPIYPEEQTIHYVYCDECGSFAIKHWIEPENHLQLMQWEDRFNSAMTFFLVATVLSVILAFFGLFPLLIISLLGLGVSYAGAEWLGRRIDFRGVYCADCQTQYKNRSPFFDNVKENPRGFTMADVPKPLYEVYQVPG